MTIRLFVGNLPYGAQEAELRAHLAAVGEPAQIIIPVDRETGRPRGFAFVDFDDRAVGERAIQEFDGQPFMGRPLAVSEARPRDARPPVAGAGAARGSGAAPSPATMPPERTAPVRRFGPPAGRTRPRHGGTGRRQQEERPKRTLKERTGGRMFTVEEDWRFAGPDTDAEDEVATTGEPGDEMPDQPVDETNDQTNDEE